MNGPFRSDAATWSPVNSIVSEEPAVRSSRGPSLFFVVGVIGGAALLTAGAVALFAIEPSQSAPEPEQKSTIVAEQKSTFITEIPAVTASLEPSVPVHKVTTRSISAAEFDPPAEPKAAAVEAAAEAAPAEDESVPGQHDPRWARTDGEKTTTAFASVLQSSADDGENGLVATGAIPLASPSPGETAAKTDGTETAAIAPEEVVPEKTAKAKPDKPAEAADDDKDLPPGVAASARTVQITKGVNMRSRPKSGSAVLTTVPKGAAVQVVSCKAWCEIVYKGRRGYVYKDFVGGGGRVSSAAAPKNKTVFTVNAKQPEATETTTQSASRAKPISSRLR